MMSIIVAIWLSRIYGDMHVEHGKFGNHGLWKMLEGVLVHCTTQSELRVQRSSDISFSSCTVPTYYCDIQVFHMESGAQSLEVSLEIKCSLDRDDPGMKDGRRLGPVGCIVPPQP